MEAVSLSNADNSTLGYEKHRAQRRNKNEEDLNIMNGKEST